MRAVVQAVAVVMVLALLQSTLQADPPEEKPTAPPTLAEEKERLKTLKEAEFRKLKAVVSGDAEYEKKLAALRNIAALATTEAVDLLCTLYDNPLKEDSESEQALLVELLGEASSPAAGPTLLKAVQHPGKDGKVRLAAAGAIARVMGKDAAAHLKKLAEDKVEAVKNRAWTELLKMQDLNAMRHVFKMLERKEKLAALAMIKEAHFTEAAKEVAEIARETDFSKGPNEKILKLKALETALDLGYKESAAVTIELLGAITGEQAKVLEVHSPHTLLRNYTQQKFPEDKEKWQEWWEGKGKDAPLFGTYANATALEGIGIAAADWMRREKSVPLTTREILYLERSELSLATAQSEKTVRVYTSVELGLLGVTYLSMRYVKGNKNHAFIVVDKPGSKWFLILGLERKDQKWTVILP